MSSWTPRPSFTATRSGKYIFWQEDITELVALLEELRLTQEELHDIGDIIQAETAQKAQWLKLSEQNRLYDKIETVTARQLARIQEYLIALKATDDVDTARRLLKHIVILEPISSGAASCFCLRQGGGY